MCAADTQSKTGEMEIKSLSIPNVKVLTPQRFEDSRGFFAELYSKRTFCQLGVDCEFVQDNHSFSMARGTVRGLHFQLAPFAQAKLVRAVRGAIFDVAVDISPQSATFGRHVSAILSADNARQMFIPIGFAHGFMTLEPDTEIAYKVSDYFSVEHDRGLFWNDPELRIDWPLREHEIALSEKDRALPCFRELSTVMMFA